MLRLRNWAPLVKAVVELKRGMNITSQSANKNYSSILGCRSYEWNDVFIIKNPKLGIGASTSRAQSPGVNIPSVHTATSRAERGDFMAVFPDIVRDLTDAGRHLNISDAMKWFKKSLHYNIPDGKLNRGLLTVLAYRMLASKDQLTPENIRLAQIMGWCVEMLRASSLVLDDIIDKSTTRRGRPCWYLHKDIGLSAVNDVILLENGLYQLLKRYIQDKPYYIAILELFRDITFKTSLGEVLDLLTPEYGHQLNLEKFTMTRYSAIVEYKTAHYSFYLPVAIAMHMAGIRDEEMHRQAKSILLKIGHFYQVQNDFLDCFGDPEITGKVGTDIATGRCSWLIVVALQRATAEQRAVLKQIYGSEDPEKVAAVKELYKQLGMPTTYSIYEEENYKLISTRIQQMSRGLPHELFFKCLETFYRKQQ